MSHITNCLRCGKCYEESSEEQANSPYRMCNECFRLERGLPTYDDDGICWNSDPHNRRVNP